MVEIITKYDYAKRPAPGINFSPKTNPADRSLTNQADMDSADINKIMERYEKTGVLIDPAGVERRPMYGDFTEVKDYHTTLSAIRRTEQAFNLLPANVRNRFNNDPQILIQFLDDPKNDAEAVELGLKPKPVLPPVPAAVQAEADKEKEKPGNAPKGASTGAAGTAAPVPPAQ